MGSKMVYRYRPMRLVPTMTTRVIIVPGSFCVDGDIMGGRRGRQQVIGSNLG